MKKILIAGITALLLPLTAHSSIKTFYIQDALNLPAAKEQVDEAILFFADEYGGAETVMETVLAGPRVEKQRKKKVEVSCHEAFVEALVSLQAQAAVKKATGVVNIHSYLPVPFVPDIPFVSTTEYQCEVGRRLVRVVLKGGLIRQGSAASTSSSSEPAAERLKKLKALRDQGLIDDAAYKRRQAEILREL